MKYIVVVVGYFTKWIKAEALLTITAAKIRNFIWRRIVYRFGVPLAIVTFNGIQFTRYLTRDLCEELGIQMRFALIEHPQTNGKVESANKVILNGLKKKLDEAKGLWAYNTTIKSSIGETPYRLTFGTCAILPVEIQNKS